MATWDDYWTKEIAEIRWIEHHRCRLSGSPLLKLVDRFDPDSAWRRILVVGCGISTEPAALAHIGYNVVAIDMSEVAIQYVKAHPPTRNEIANWLTEHCRNDEATQPSFKEIEDWLRRQGEGDKTPFFDVLETATRLDALYRPGGSLEARCLDFRELDPVDSFDVVYSPWSWQCLEPDLRRELPGRAFAWLATGGACLLVTQNLQDALEAELYTVFAAAGFFPGDPQRRLPQAWQDDDARARLAAGEKMHFTYRGSG
jgi:SAM-dependent methyltransferase